MTVAWHERPAELRALLNPAFIATIVHEASDGYRQERERALPFVLAFLVVPLVLHEQTREAMPNNVTTSMAGWLNANGGARVRIAPLAQDLVPFVREGIRFGVRRGALSFEGDALLGAPLRRAPRGMASTDVPRCRDRAVFAGRWLARAGDPVSVLASWGLAI